MTNVPTRGFVKFKARDIDAQEIWQVVHGAEVCQSLRSQVNSALLGRVSALPGVYREACKGAFRPPVIRSPSLPPSFHRGSQIGSQNVGGDDQKKLDVLSNDLFINMLKSSFEVPT